MLADELRALALYDRITFVAHSMGGILVRGALAKLFELERRRVLRSIVGVILAASPTLGSLRVPRWTLPFSADARALYPHNRYLQRISSTLASRINPEFQQTATARRAAQIPVWALLGSHDFWVDRLSASVGLPDSQVRTVRGPHGCICATQRDHEGYQYIKGCLESAFGIGKEEPADEPEVRCEDAREEDASQIHEFAVRTLGPDVTPIYGVSELLRSKGVFRIIKEIENDGDSRTERLTGYFCALPLTDEAAAALKSGKMTGAAIGSRHLTARAEDSACIYIGAVAGRGPYPKGMIVRELKYYLQNQLAKKNVELVTRPISPDGERLARKYGFEETYRSGNGPALWACTNWTVT